MFFENYDKLLLKSIEKTSQPPTWYTFLIKKPKIYYCFCFFQNNDFKLPITNYLYDLFDIFEKNVYNLFFSQTTMENIEKIFLGLIKAYFYNDIKNFLKKKSIMKTI